MSSATGQISEGDRGHAPKGTVNSHFRPKPGIQLPRLTAANQSLAVQSRLSDPGRSSHCMNSSGYIIKCVAPSWWPSPVSSPVRSIR